MEPASTMSLSWNETSGKHTRDRIVVSPIWWDRFLDDNIREAALALLSMKTETDDSAPKRIHFKV